MSKQTQVQVPKRPAPKDPPPADPPTTNKKIARTWFAPA
jgi:hypothetical protein